MNKGIIVALAGLAFLIGCGNQGDKGPGIPVGPKWKGATYRISVDPAAVKPNPAGVTIPGIKYTANPEALEKRVVLVVRVDTSGVKKNVPVMDQMIMPPVDISGADGSIPSDYLASGDKGLSTLLSAYCMTGKVKITVAMARSSLSPQASDGELNSKRLSDWMPLELVFKNPHPKC